MEKTVLIVDDSEFDRNILSNILTRHNLKTILAKNASECYQQLKDHKIDLILLDILMPDELGTAVLKKIRENQDSIALPIIMITSKKDSEDIVEALKLGANDYITKPINIMKSANRILMHLNPAKMGVVASYSIDTFLQAIPNLLPKIHSAIKSENQVELQNSILKLKAFINNIETDQVLILINLLEKLGKENNFEEAQTTLDRLNIQLSIFEQAMNEMQTENN